MVALFVRIEVVLWDHVPNLIIRKLNLEMDQERLELLMKMFAPLTGDVIGNDERC